jgi:hypothetical protein
MIRKSWIIASVECKKKQRNMIDLSDKGVDICMDSGGVNNSYSLRIINMLKIKDFNLFMCYTLNVCNREKWKKRKKYSWDMLL